MARDVWRVPDNTHVRHREGDVMKDDMREKCDMREVTMEIRRRAQQRKRNGKMD